MVPNSPTEVQLICTVTGVFIHSLYGYSNTPPGGLQQHLVQLLVAGEPAASLSPAKPAVTNRDPCGGGHSHCDKQPVLEVV